MGHSPDEALGRQRGLSKAREKVAEHNSESSGGRALPRGQYLRAIAGDE